MEQREGSAPVADKEPENPRRREEEGGRGCWKEANKK